MESIRWAFRVAAWQPTRDQWTWVSRCVQSEEKQRIGQFVFQKDAKSAMAGRLLLRRVIHKQLGIPYSSIQLLRTEKGKPYLAQAAEHNLSFNVSHQGEYAVLAAEPRLQVGVDVMQVQYPKGSRTVEEFFTNMNRQFTNNEWKIIKEPLDEWEQLEQFYRFWCLKESYVKAVGVGIGFSLQRLDFCPQSELSGATSGLCDTRLCVDGILQKDWKFEEQMLDRTHCLAVAVHQQAGTDSLPTDSTPFTTLSYEDLIDGSAPATEEDPGVWTAYCAKQQTKQKPV